MVDYVKRLETSVAEHLDKIEFQSPGLFLDAEAWQTLDAKLADPFFADLHQRNLQALACLQTQANGGRIFDVPETLGEEPAVYGYPAVWPSRVCKNILCRATVAYYITKEQAYLDYAIAAMDAACELDEWHCHAPQMGLRGANLETGDLLFALAFGFDALYPHVSDDQRQRYIACLRDKGLAAYQKGVEEGDWWIDNSYNWNPSLNGNAVIAALVLLPHEPLLAKNVISFALPRVGLHMHKYLAGGGYSEGPMYQCTGVGHMSDMVIAWHRQTGDDLGLAEHSGFIDTMALWSYLIGGDGRIMNISNCDEFGHEYNAAQVAWWARHLQRPDLLDYHHKMQRPWQDTHQLFYDVEFFWHQEAHQPVEAPDVSGLKHFPEIDWLSYKADDIWLMICGGWNGGGHHNQDQGHLILGYGKERFLCDPGYGKSTMDQHNTFKVQGQNACHGCLCPLEHIESFSDGFYATVNLQSAFPFATAFCRRHFIVTENKHILIIDDVAGQYKEWSDGYQEKVFADPTWYWQTRLPVEIADNTFKINGKRHSLQVRMLAAIGAIQQKEWDHQGQIRTLSYRSYANNQRNIMPCVLSFADASGSWDVDGQRHVFTLNDRRFEFEHTDQGLVKI